MVSDGVYYHNNRQIIAHTRLHRQSITSVNDYASLTQTQRSAQIELAEVAEARSDQALASSTMPSFVLSWIYLESQRFIWHACGAT